MNKRLAASVSGLFALSATATNAATTSCSTVAACVFGSNTSSGIGVEGSSKSGAGATGTSTSGYGLSGISSSSHGVNGISSSSFGVVGTTTENATSPSNARAGVLGQDSSTNKSIYDSGVAGTSKYGTGVIGMSSSGVGVAGNGGTYGGRFGGGRGLLASGIDVDPDRTIGSTSPDGTYAGAGGFLNVYGVADDGGSSPFPPQLLFDAVGCLVTPYQPEPSPVNCVSVFNIYSDGTGYFGSAVYSAGSSVVKTKSSTGKDVATFGARSASPTVEDFGSATLRNGVASVALDKTFASTISTGYMVFVTPHGDSNSLYTTGISPSGFVVRESKNGRSTLAFDYRIVGKPIDAKAMHVPLASAFPEFAKRADTARKKSSSLRVASKPY